MLTGFRWGFLAALALFCADALGAFAAIGSLFDPTLSGAALVGIAALVQAGVGGVLGAVLGTAAFWLRTPRLALSRRGIQLSALAVLLAVGVSGYWVRVGRAHQALGPRPTVSGPQQKALLLVVVDTLRADTLYGENYAFPHAPRLKELARDAVIFGDAESAAGWTIPSVATLLTGIHPGTLYTARRFLPSWAPTLAEHLRAGGYRTHAVVDNSLLERRNGFADGFEQFKQRSAFRFAFSLPAFRFLPKWVEEWLRMELPVAYVGAPAVVDAALDALEPPEEAPLFLYAHFMDVHHPFYAHKPDPAGSQPIGMHFANTRLRENKNGPNGWPSAEELAFLKHRYAGEIEFLDPHLSRLIETFRAEYDNDCWVVVTSDHGEEFMDHNELGHGHRLYRELVHVPLMIWAPEDAGIAMTPGLPIETPVGLVDVAPTLLQGLGVPPLPAPVPIQGHSLMPWMQGQATAPVRPLYAEQSHTGRRIYRWREGPWSRIVTFVKGDDVRGELFMVSEDPTEQNNVRVAEGERWIAMSARESAFVSVQEESRPNEKSEASADIEALRALGYVQ